MFVRRRHAVAAVLAVALLTTGCGSPASSPTPEPTATAPSPTDSDTAAFAAAEATYRAYVDALNAVDLSDPTTFEPVLALTTDEAEVSVARSFEEMRSKSWQVEGRSTIVSLSPDEMNAARTRATLAVCLDVSRVSVVDKNGASMVGDRPDIQSLQISATRSDDGWLLSKFESNAVPRAC
ncbi:hypothetical protein ACI2K6_03570 [Microbacterium sp. NPDC006705]|uniref:hypothetical protein n=1 Tax=Microbacterium sp. NPDC006705 TaxID=3364181 RepID=UPI00384A9166